MMLLVGLSAPDFFRDESMPDRIFGDLKIVAVLATAGSDSIGLYGGSSFLACGIS